MKKQSLLILLLIFALLLGGCFFDGNVFPSLPTKSPAPTETHFVSDKLLTVSFLDVGQGDSIFIEFPQGGTMLIDAGEQDEGDDVLSYIKRKGYEKLDYVVCTHPHADHIGGMSTVIKNLDVGTVYMPRVYHESRTYERLLETIRAKNLSVKKAKYGATLSPEPDVTLEFLAPIGGEYQEKNDHSAVIRLSYGNRRFLFTGDAEAVSEEEMLALGLDVSADVLKVGHHGSDSSTKPKFLDAVNPRYAVISCGDDNSYGHPDLITLENLEARNIKIYRTDWHETVVMTTDGETIQVMTEED